MEGPLKKYQAIVAEGHRQSDPAQLEAVTLLQSLHDQLVSQPVRKQGFMDRLLGKQAGMNKTRGLYFWGGVGRGKTFLMDLFYEELPVENKRRLHFHRFMREVHRQLTELQGEVDPLKKVAANFASQAQLLCFDEFFVSDITDAMLLAGLLDELFERGVVLVATSNVEPDQLYDNGLQRRKFLPAIELIKANTIVHNMDGGIDYRLRALESAELYHYPLDADAEATLAASFQRLSPDEGRADVVLTIENREIRTRYCGDGVVWFDFEAICDGPRSQNDYIELAQLFQTVLVGHVPVFSEKMENQARRFISLVDEFYDRHVKLILTAEAPILELYQGALLTFEFQRTESRLQEMQSHDYLASEHLP